MVWRMSEQEPRDNAAAAYEAHQAAAPLRKALTLARIALAQAKTDVNHLDAENTRVWNAAYDAAVKKQGTALHLGTGEATHTRAT
jgi:hypothetical protein